jgi:2-iminobutanoate/2-iminopropanoate deaminase
MSKETVRTERAPAPFQGAPYSQAIVHGDLVFVSGQLGLDPETAEVVDGGIGPQTDRALENVRAILEEAGSSMDKVLQVSIFIVDLGEFGAMNEVYSRLLEQPYPARATVQIGALPSGARIEIAVVAHL